MKKNRSIIIVFTIVFAIYFLLELLFDNEMLYFLGGISVALLQEALKILVKNSKQLSLLKELMVELFKLNLFGVFLMEKYNPKLVTAMQQVNNEENKYARCSNSK